MRIDNCRKCGIKLEIKQNCSICESPVKFVCKQCNFETDEQIHSICKLVDMNNKPLHVEAA